MTPQIVLKQELKQVVLEQKSWNPLILNQEIKQIVIQGGPIVANICPFTATCTVQGQTVFQLLNSQGGPITFSTIICLFIMGTGQNILSGDYTYANGLVTLGTSAPVMDVGDLLFGAGQV